jgi:hypothetical protein
LEERRILDKYIDDLLLVGEIEESMSSLAISIIMVRKTDLSYRICIDYRALNTKIPQDNNPLPLIDDLLNSIYGKRVFTKLDLRNAYN